MLVAYSTALVNKLVVSDMTLPTVTLPCCTLGWCTCSLCSMTNLWNYSTGFTGKWIVIRWTHEESEGTYSALQMGWTDSPSSHPHMVLTAKAMSQMQMHAWKHMRCCSWCRHDSCLRRLQTTVHCIKCSAHWHHWGHRRRSP